LLYNIDKRAAMIGGHQRDSYRHTQEAFMRRVFNFLIGVIVGGLVGSAAVILFTPASGEEVRSQISERARAFAADIRQAANTRRIELQERLEVLRAPRS